MIEISIGNDLAASHPGFMTGCGERGQRVEVFEEGELSAAAFESG